MYDNDGYGGAGQPPQGNGSINMFASLLALGMSIIITPFIWSHLGVMLNPFIVEQYGPDWSDFVSGFLKYLLYPLVWAALKASIALLMTSIMVYGATRLPIFAA